jgi:hypothetical protein
MGPYHLAMRLFRIVVNPVQLCFKFSWFPSNSAATLFSLAAF